ncbi:MAG: hypothetical protein CMB25_05905 [Euryarchaeota archaeon]|nr:hypothetical protein [Euryarchaeota archaeon]MAY05116.1 hypothetical protein [Euryarchaeota archaeon]|tara:strand:- start:14330 stop:15172 length:843 start_codon:yes stop_codon:yes gene_type:complete
MAWPFGSAGNDRDADAELAEERLKIMANVAIEQVPLPEQGELSEEDAWTISPGPTRARLNSIGSVPSVAATLAPQPAAPVNAQVDTSGLERMISSRLDMVEDVLGLISHKMEQGNVVAAVEGEEPSHDDDDDVASVDGAVGDTIVTADGEVLPVGDGVDRLRHSDEARLVELYEAQALAANPFLAKGSYEEAANDGVGAAMVAALLLDNLSGMAAVSFAQKAVQSGMLSEDEGRAVLAIVQLAAPGEAESALNDHLSHRKLLTFSAIVESWRSQTSKSEE